MIHIEEHVPLGPQTTFEIGGSARYFTQAHDEHEVKDAVLWARARNVPIFVLGGGSNLLVPDEGLEALVIKICIEKWHADGIFIHAGAGCNLTDTIRECSLIGLGGWESMAGIPGTIGGAIRGNAGAFGTETRNVLASVRVLDVHNLSISRLENPACEFAYRHSMFKKHPEFIILDAIFKLRPVTTKQSAAAIRDTIAERERRHIQNVRAAGSYFVNPVAPEGVRNQFEAEKNMTSREGRVPAGWLIEKSGMKGVRVGDAQSSEQHADYIINVGKATAKDVRKLAEKIKSAVKKEFAVDLREEAVIL